MPPFSSFIDIVIGAPGSEEAQIRLRMSSVEYSSGYVPQQTLAPHHVSPV
jgi:hypothetical protein